VQLKVKAPNVPEDVAIEAAIKGLRIGDFASYPAWEKPSTIEELYNEFEKYCRSHNDLRKRLEKQNQNMQYQGNNRNAQRGNRSQGQSQPQQGPDRQVFNIDQQVQQAPEAVPNKGPQKQYEGKRYSQGKKWNKNQDQRQ